MPERELITVVIPTCDKPEHLAVCLEALRPGAQILPSDRYEVVVSDDGPRKLARAMVAERFPWARWVEGPQRGPAANRNAGVAAAHGERLAFTDDDCIPGARWLAALSVAIDRHPDCAFEGKTRADPGFTSVWDEAPANETGGYFWSCNIAMLRTHFERAGGFDEAYRHPNMEDVDLRTALGEQGVGVRFVPTALVLHPIRRSRPKDKLAGILRAEAQVYYARKWAGASRGAILAELVQAVTRHFLLRGARNLSRGGLGLMLVYPAIVATLILRTPGWYRRADALLNSTPGARARPHPGLLPGHEGHRNLGVVELTDAELGRA